jgi:hypothetical protein
MRLLQNTSTAVGDLIMTYKRVSNLAGHTARVAELLEQVGGPEVGGAESRWGWGGAGSREGNNSLKGTILVPDPALGGEASTLKQPFLPTSASPPDVALR